MSPFVTMFSTLFNYCTFIWRAFPFWFGYDVKVVCCGFIVCAKGLNFFFQCSDVLKTEVSFTIKTNCLTLSIYNHANLVYPLIRYRCFVTEFGANVPVLMSQVSAYVALTSPGSSVGSDAGCQSTGSGYESQLGNHYFRRLTKVTVTSVIRLPPMGLQSMWKSSHLLGKYVVWITGVRKLGNTWIAELAVIWLNNSVCDRGNPAAAISLILAVYILDPTCYHPTATPTACKR